MKGDKGTSKMHRDAKPAAQPGAHALRLHREPGGAREYLAERLDGARDLYLLALALGVRGETATLFGQMIREARIHFTTVIEECRIAGLDTSAIAVMLGGKNEELVDSIRPEIWGQLEQLIAQRARGQTR
jgi:hypothetical protein